MKKMISALLVFGLFSVAHADDSKCVSKKLTLQGDQAVGLAFLLKNTGFAKKVPGKQLLTLTVDKLECSEISRGVSDSALPNYNCSSPEGTSILTSKLIFETLSTAGVFGDAGLSHIFVSAQDIKCVIDSSGNVELDKNPTCEVTAIWEKDCQ